MIKAIIFDFYGVLVRDGWLPFKEQYFRHDQNLWNQATKLNQAADRGIISYEDFLVEIAALAGITPEAVREQTVSTETNNELLSLIEKRIKPKYKICMLSNAAVNRLG